MCRAVRCGPWSLWRLTGKLDRGQYWDTPLRWKPPEINFDSTSNTTGTCLKYVEICWNTLKLTSWNRQNWYLGVSINGGIQKWLVYNGKSNLDPYFRKPPNIIFLQFGVPPLLGYLHCWNPPWHALTPPFVRRSPKQLPEPRRCQDLAQNWGLFVCLLTGTATDIATDIVQI